MAQLRYSHIWIAVAVIVAAGVLWAGLSPGASADNHWVAFGEQSVETNFPDDMIFSLEFSADRPVARVNLTFLIVGQDSRRVEPVEFEDGNPSTAEFTLRTRGGSSTYIPPGAVISYRWILEDEDGNSAETDATEFVYTDTRFEWNTVSRENVTVYYNGPVKTRAETVLDTSVETLSNMGRLLETPLTRNVNIVMYSNPVQMKDALPFISRTSSSGLVTQGQAHGKEGVLLINGFDSQIKGIVSHEVTHLLIAQAAEGPGKRVPAWLNEGLAEYGNIEPGFSYDLAVLRAVRTDTLYPLVQLANRPGEPDAVIVFYGHSRQVVDFMIRTFGTAKMSELLREFRDGQLNFEDTLEKVYGIDLITLDNMWRESIGVPPVSMERIGNRPASTTPTPIPTRAPLGAPTTTPPPDSTSDIEIENGELALEKLRQAYGTISGDPDFDATADLNNDNVVNYLDLAILGAKLPSP